MVIRIMSKVLITFGIILVLITGCVESKIVGRWSAGKVINTSYTNSNIFNRAKTTVVTDINTYLVDGCFIVKNGTELEVVKFKDSSFYLSGGNKFSIIVG